MKIVQLLIISGGKMRKEIKKSPTRKNSRSAENKTTSVKLSASQQRLLQILATGIEGEEPDLLAGRP
ncbi:hypothetical protein ACQKP5_09650 [Pseudomonas vancouverensis]|uniref:hypothetical protein n=1 Tax=Pseudomonas vancouverensis TaxID=95300 RepID=UPI003CFD3317